MNIKEFENAIVEVLIKKYGENSRIEVRDVKKNNAITRRALLVSVNKDVNIATTLYFDDLYESFMTDGDFEREVESLIEVIERYKIDENMDLSLLSDFEKLKDKVFCKVINREKNKELLKTIPHVDYLDLSIVFYALLESTLTGRGTTLIDNMMLEELSVDTIKLFRAAKKNTIETGDFNIKSIEEVLFEMIRATRPYLEAEAIIENIKNDDYEMYRIPMYVVSNRDKTFGATALIYSQLIDAFSDSLNSDIYILPSSLHELIVIPANVVDDCNDLKRMVRQVNSTEVSEYDYLSDSVYFYSFEAKKLQCVGM